MTQVLVTGGLGFIGSEFIRRSAADFGPILNVDLGTYAGDVQRLESVPRGSVETIHLDVADPDFIELVKSRRPRTIVHLAAESHVTRSEKEKDLFVRTNVQGTENVMRAALESGTERVVHISTDEVYGPALGAPFREEEKGEGEGNATSAYARSKGLADDIALSYRERLPVIVARPTNCFGPWQHPEKAVARWIARALTGHRLPVWGDGKQVRDWMHVEDACAAIMTLVESGVPGEAYNIAPMGPELTNLALAQTIAQIAGGSAGDVYLTQYDRPEHDFKYAIDASKMAALGWEPESLESGLVSTVGWYRYNRPWWAPILATAESLYDDDLERRTEPA